MSLPYVHYDNARKAAERPPWVEHMLYVPDHLSSMHRTHVKVEAKALPSTCAVGHMHTHVNTIT